MEGCRRVHKGAEWEGREEGFGVLLEVGDGAEGGQGGMGREGVNVPPLGDGGLQWGRGVGCFHGDGGGGISATGHSGDGRPLLVMVGSGLMA